MAARLAIIQFVDSMRINLGLIQPDVDVLWDLAPHDLSILDFVLPDDVFPMAIAAHTGDPWDAGGHASRIFPSGCPTVPGSCARELAEPDQDPDNGVRWLPAHNRVG